MKRYIVFVLLVLGIELSVLFGISIYFSANLLSTMFFGSIGFSILAFLMGTNGDAFSKNSQMKTFEVTGGAYIPKHEETTLKIGTFLLGSILCFIVYLVMEVLI